VAYGTAAIPWSDTPNPFLLDSSLPAPALQQRLDTFPFMVLGFHSDNGSEYLNKQAAKLLGKLLIEFTKSRSRHSNEREACPWGITRWQKAKTVPWLGNCLATLISRNAEHPSSMSSISST